MKGNNNDVIVKDVPNAIIVQGIALLKLIIIFSYRLKTKKVPPNIAIAKNIENSSNPGIIKNEKSVNKEKLIIKIIEITKWTYFLFNFRYFDENMLNPKIIKEILTAINGLRRIAYKIK